MRPVRLARISQPFADPGSYASRSDAHGPAGHHTGVDYAAQWGTSIFGRWVRSVMSGTVVISEYNPTMGHWVGVYNAERNVTYTYWHLSRRSVNVGDRVQQGRILGKVGSSGNSTGPHVHVQANHGRGFDYHDHFNPWAAYGLTWPQIKRRRRRQRRNK